MLLRIHFQLVFRRRRVMLSKLEQLEKEVQTIKNAVNPSPVSAAGVL
ncbi:unnamed protein product, partial [Colletotrichum noveboracense]